MITCDSYLHVLFQTDWTEVFRYLDMKFAKLTEDIFKKLDAIAANTTTHSNNVCEGEYLNKDCH